MKVLTHDLTNLKRLIRRRIQSSAGRDEVWDGLLMMSPDPSTEHAVLAGRLAHILYVSIDPADVSVISVGGNISDRRVGWTKNFRCPDLMVFLPGNSAEDCGTHWCGGPDFAIEILSSNDHSRKKFDFYAKVGVREILLVDRKPWRLELFRLDAGRYARTGVAEARHSVALTSQTLGLTLRLVSGPSPSRPQIEVTRPVDGRTWIA